MSPCGAEKDTSVIESQIACAFFDCVIGSDSVGFHEITDVSIVSELVADRQAVPRGLSTAQPEFSAFTSADKGSRFSLLFASRCQGLLKGTCDDLDTRI